MQLLIVKIDKFGYFRVKVKRQNTISSQPVKNPNEHKKFTQP